MLGHEPLPWDAIKGLGDMFTDLRELGAAATRIVGRRWISHTTTRQIVREVPTGRLEPREALNLDGGRLGLRLVLNLARTRRPLSDGYAACYLHLSKIPILRIRTDAALL